MKYFIIGTLLFFVSVPMFSQIISDDGKFVFVDKFIRSTIDAWKQEIPIAEDAFFSSDDKFIFQKHDTLCIFKAGTSEITEIPKVLKFEKAVSKYGECIVYLSSAIERNFHIFSIQLQKEVYSLDDVSDFLVGSDLKVVGLKNSKAKKESVLCLFLSDSICSPRYITYRNLDLKKIVFDSASKQLAFSTSELNESNEIWYFNKEMDSAKCLVSDRSESFLPGFKLSDDKSKFGFTFSGKNLCFLVEQRPDTKSSTTNAPSVDVWSYNDALIQSQQIAWKATKADEYQPQYLATIDLTQSHPKVILLQHRNQILCGISMGYGKLEISDNYLLIFEPQGDLASDFAGERQGYLLSDYKWNKATKCKVFLVSLNSGKQVLIKEVLLRTPQPPLFKFSVDQNYIVFFDEYKEQFFSYEINSGLVKNISQKANTSWINSSSGGTIEYYDIKRYSIAWLREDSHLLVTDHFGDCWNLDPKGEAEPTILTNRMGINEHILFYPVSHNSVRPDVIEDGIILFHAERNRLEKGFYFKVVPDGPLVKIVLGPYNSPGLRKAASATVFLLNLETAKAPRGWYLLDCHSCQPKRLDDLQLKNLRPINKDIVHWKTIDKQIGTGLLYKPENFDTMKKYPVIIHYYEKEASRIANAFDTYDENTTSISWAAEPPVKYCLSHGYLVFILDINYTIGSAGQSVYDYVVSATNYLRNQPYVDERKIGIEGHSFAGWETNYLVTHTNIFAAAVSGSGLSNYFATFNNINNDPQGYPFDGGQVRIGVTPWDRPDLFMKNSPVFYADRVSTPVLFMANRNDLRVPYSQSIALFKALRRLGKRSWLLQYDNGEHLLDKKEDAVDFGIRQMQFFDHYLKGAPAPVWMTRGIPASQKGKTLGYEYDSVIKTPGPGLYMENPDAYTPDEKELLKHKTTVNNGGRIVDVIEPRKK